MFKPSRRSDTGHTTAEYAVGTVGAACVGCVLIQTGQSDWFLDLIQQIIDQVRALAAIATTPGIGGIGN